MTTSSAVPGSTVDADGQSVSAGDRVRVLSVKASILERLTGVDRTLVAGMVGQVFTVEEVDPWGGAWVRVQREEGKGRVMSHSISLAPQDMRRLAQ